ncbi:MAG TPA: XrtN system VIT domain-containing protein [Puia sp.]|nr:XrtN system VIT domain-containing protein [Puia sp.]
MQPTATKTKPDRLWFFGLILLLASTLLFYLPGIHAGPTTIFNGLFLVNYGMAVLYLALLLFAGDSIRRGNNRPSHVFLFLNLALISCYALNRSIPIFENSSPWWAAVLTICCANYITIFFFPRLPHPIKAIICFITGIAFAAFLYLAVYLLNFYVIGFIGSLALGLSLHVFVPLLFVIFTIDFITRARRIFRRSLHFFFGGFLLALVFTAQYAVRWNVRVKAINNDVTTANATPNNLPNWITVAQHCPPTPLDNAILSSDIFYSTARDLEFEWMPHPMRNQTMQHDPLIVIATAFSGTPRLTEDEKISILRSVFASRHQTQRRNWEGDDLQTTDIATSVQLWPEQHLSYTEENITIASEATTQGWQLPTGEALYTFHLPEGAVVSALSLWIEGKERKAILTTRQKADAAYSTIVGQYHRDPSVVHWQEGNTVTVRVFPVTPEQSRRFKLGITAPLELNGKKLVYHSIWFDGPTAANARSSIRILPMQPLTKPEWPPSFQSDSTGHLRYKPSLLTVSTAMLAPIRQSGVYIPDWTLGCLDPGIHPATFSFDGKQYTAAAHTPAMETASFRQAYVDLNSSWTPEDYQSLLASLDGLPVYASLTGDDLVSITANNKKEIFDACSKRHFSLFPLSRVTDYNNSLLISKSTAHSPNFFDLRGSAFTGQLQGWLENGGHIRLYDFGDALSPYLKALKEAGAFRYQKGDLFTLQSQLHHHRFPIDNLAANEVLIEPAGLLIRSTDAPGDPAASAAQATTTSIAQNTAAQAATTSFTENATAPDHLLRLFAYRRILQQQQSRLPGEFPDSRSAADTTQVQMSQEAGIVSPVSSYVVLEKKADYDAFNIQESRNSLQNASLHGKGAVPEPGQWAILVSLFGFLVAVRGYRLRKQSSTSQ